MRAEQRQPFPEDSTQVQDMGTTLRSDNVQVEQVGTTLRDDSVQEQDNRVHAVPRRCAAARPACMVQARCCGWPCCPGCPGWPG